MSPMNLAENDAKFSLRIGVHLGDVIHRRGDIFGDAVNIASRVQSVAPPNGVCVSGQVFDQVRNKMRLSIQEARKSRTQEC